MCLSAVLKVSRVFFVVVVNRMDTFLGMKLAYNVKMTAFTLVGLFCICAKGVTTEPEGLEGIIESNPPNSQCLCYDTCTERGSL